MLMPGLKCITRANVVKSQFLLDEATIVQENLLSNKKPSADELMRFRFGPFGDELKEYIYNIPDLNNEFNKQIQYKRLIILMTVTRI